MTFSLKGLKTITNYQYEPACGILSLLDILHIILIKCEFLGVLQPSFGSTALCYVLPPFLNYLNALLFTDGTHVIVHIENKALSINQSINVSRKKKG